MPKKEKRKEKRKVRTGCQHEYIRTEGIISCAHCPMRAIQYLSRSSHRATQGNGRFEP